MSNPGNLQFEEKSGCLIIRVFGRDIVERKETTFEAIAAAIKPRAPKATLLDLRTVRGPITFLDRYQFGEMVARFLGQYIVASLILEEQGDKQRIGQQVARNRGAQVEVFTDPAAAEAWLAKYAGPDK